MTLKEREKKTIDIDFTGLKLWYYFWSLGKLLESDSLFADYLFIGAEGFKGI